MLDSNSEFKEQLENDIAYAKSSAHQIRVQADEGSGVIITNALLSQKVTDVFEIEFKIADGYKFNNWQAFVSSNDGTLSPLTEEYISFLESTSTLNGIYKARVKFIKATAQTIVIMPLCQQLPKIISIVPSFESSGCDQDTTVKIIFNKPVDVSSFGDFEGISISKADGTNLIEEGYFNSPYFSDNDTVLNFPTSKTKLIIDKNSSEETADITISLVFSDLKDMAGLEFSLNENYSYRVNKRIDDTAPQITDASFYNTQDKSSSIYRELSQKDFAEWTSNGEELENGEFGQNHCAASLFYSLQGFDERSGLAGVRITETYLKNIYGDDVAAENFTGDYVLEGDYNFKSLNDGLLKLDFELVDNAGNLSTKRIFYQIYYLCLLNFFQF